jgi:hypothetical protein
VSKLSSDTDYAQFRVPSGTIRVGSEWVYRLVWPRHWLGTVWRVEGLAATYPYPFEQVILRSLLPAEDGIWLVMSPSQLVGAWTEATPEAVISDVAPAAVAVPAMRDPMAACREVGE